MSSFQTEVDVKVATFLSYSSACSVSIQGVELSLRETWSSTEVWPWRKQQKEHTKWVTWQNWLLTCLLGTSLSKDYEAMIYMYLHCWERWF